MWFLLLIAAETALGLLAVLAVLWPILPKPAVLGPWRRALRRGWVFPQSQPRQILVVLFAVLLIAWAAWR